MTDLALSVRPGYPDFLDLPWDHLLEAWAKRCPRLEEVPRGQARHPVVFVNYDGGLYAIKELAPERALKEYEVLRRMEELRLPAVVAVGHARTQTAGGEGSALITQYLDHSLPYHVLFTRSGLTQYRPYLLDALASLLVQLHLRGVFWGDCSLSNTLFRRNAGALQAYLVDAETSEVHPQLSARLRAHELDITEENVYGALVDLAAVGLLPRDYPVTETGRDIRGRYERLWGEISREELIAPGERYRIQERIRALNDLGFSVDEVELKATASGEQLRMRAFVTDRNFHRDLLQNLTGLDVEELQAQKMLNEVQELKATLSQTHNRSMPLSVAAHHWLNEIYMPTMARLQGRLGSHIDAAEAYCQLLEHKWYLSERAHQDVGHQAAADDYLERFAQ